MEEGTPLVRNLAAIGVEPQQFDWVIFTHLHFDHAGGATVRGDRGGLHRLFRGPATISSEPNGKTRAAVSRRVGTGFTSDSLRQLSAALKAREVDTSPFVSLLASGERRGVTWVKPELVGQVELTEWTGDGRLWHPSFQGLREDKPARQVIREEPRMVKLQPQSASGKKASRAAPRVRRAESPASSGEATANAASVAGVTLSNPNRILYSDPKITKLDLARFYEQIADWILPHVVGRPLTLVRCPEGEGGECFYQKHLTTSLPESIRGVMIREKTKREECVVIDDLAGLVSLVQMGVLEIHPWPAREDDVERPDRLVMDLDPGEEVHWKVVVQGARDVRDLLSELGLTSYLRTSGGKGLHVVTPLARRNSWDELKAFAKGIAEQMAGAAPDRYVATMSKAKRRGKVYVDYLRNQRGATAIASYSTRARPGAPVATPLAWDELSTRIRADKYRVPNLRKRLETLKVDPWAGFFTIRQSLTKKMLATIVR